MEYFGHLFNQNYNKICELDGLTTGSNLAQKGEYMPHAFSWTVLDSARHFVHTMIWTYLHRSVPLPVHFC